jgi:hypothetical protein
MIRQQSRVFVTAARCAGCDEVAPRLALWSFVTAQSAIRCAYNDYSG